LLKSSEANEKQEVGANAKGGIGGIFKALVGWEASVPADLMSAFQLIPYQSVEDAVFKALGVE
jgi:predicted ATP-dependent Lon-type protease